MLMLVREVWKRHLDQLRHRGGEFSSLLPPLLVLLIPQVTVMIFVFLNKMLHRLRERLHAVWTHHEILHLIDNLVLEEDDLTPGENIIPQNVTGDPFAGNAKNHPT